MADSARGIHVSPGIYTRETVLEYSSRSLGITTLGVVGETLKGPAFQPMDISNWREFQNVFGGTSTEKFKGSQYPKYELPYIAKSYLSESEQLKVVRVLGLSGYNAGPAWVVTASDSEETIKQAVAVIRSRGSYSAYLTDDGSGATSCTCESSKFDTLQYFVGQQKKPTNSSGCTKLGFNLDALRIEQYIPLTSDGDVCNGYNMEAATDDASWDISPSNRGRFKLIGIKGTHDKDDIKKFWEAYEAKYHPVVEETTSQSEEQKAAAAAKAAQQEEDYNNLKDDFFEYAVSLNPYDRDYILNVLGTRAFDGDSPIYVESLYDVALEQGIAGSLDEQLDKINDNLTVYDVYNTADYCHLEPVNAIIDKSDKQLNRKYLGVRYLADENAQTDGIKCVAWDYGKNYPIMWSDATGLTSEFGNVLNKFPNNLTAYADSGQTTLTEEGEKYQNTHAAEFKVKTGQIYTVRQYVDANGKRNFVYAAYTKDSIRKSLLKSSDYKNNNDSKSGIDFTPYYDNLTNGGNGNNTGITATLVLNKADGLYYKMDPESTGTTTTKKIVHVELDMNDYKSAYRYASTPWIVSNLKGDAKHIELSKLFRFHTITDGDNANYEVKISIENIRPDDGVFDVVVRDINDLDESIVPLEKFARCTMTPGDPNYIGYRIGTFDGVYEVKSKYITVEIADTTAAQTSVPAGFLGYPIPMFSGTQISTITDGSVNYNNTVTTNISIPKIKYNLTYSEDIKARKQYFGLSSWEGVDIDNFTFKGNKAYINDPAYLSAGFHLDSRLELDEAPTVDGESGYKFEVVGNSLNRTQLLGNAPIIGNEADMYGSIYEDVKLRKFTVFFYGGFDGWDVYRDERTNTDNFKMTQYRGYIDQHSGEGFSFNRLTNPEALGLNQNGITSDWYAYLAGIRQFANPEATDINVLATPGIDYVNQKLLVEEVIEMVEEERADSIYVVTTPDKPSGAGDFVDEMYTPEDVVFNLEDTEIDSNYTCTYYPWVKYLDTENNQYIYLPPTKDVVRNFAATDNVAYPWFAPAGVERGAVDCVRARFITKLNDEDVLYDGRINPIKTFASDGPRIWGQKNLQINDNQLNRIAIRRLLLRLRKLIAISCIGMIFQPNDASTRQTFITTVSPILDNIRNNRGISDYRIEIDDSLEAQARYELPTKIFFKPYGALEYITIDFIVTPQGVSFDDI